MRCGLTIKAICVAELGPFTDGVALDGLSGGLDVMTGRNEAGKSTLFRALSTLIGVEHTSSARRVLALRSDRGGAPLIEADLEIDGRPWRMRKRYLAQKSAEVTDLAGGNLWRGADAEDMIGKLLSGSGRDAMRAIIWVEQTKSFALPSDGKGDLSTAVSALIEQEATEAAGHAQLRHVRDRVGAALAVYVTTQTRRPKKGGPLETAQRTKAELAARLEAAEDKLMRAADRAQRLSLLREEAGQGALSEPAIAAARERLKAAGKAVKDGEQARERLKAAEERLEKHRLLLDAAKRELTQFELWQAENSQLDREGAELVAAASRATEALDRASGRDQALQSEREIVSNQLNENRRRLASLQRAQARTAALGRLRQVEHTLALARSASELRADLVRRLAANPVSESEVQTARRLDAKLGILQARLEATATRIAITYTAGCTARVRLAGAALEDGHAVSLTEPAALEIEGLGTLTIEPSAVGNEAISERDTVRSMLSDTLKGMKIEDLASAEAALDARRALEQDVAALDARLAATAPDGVDALERACEAAQGEAARLEAGEAAGSSDLAASSAGLVDTDGTQLEAEGRALSARLGEIDAQLATIQKELGEVAAKAAGIEARQDLQQKRKLELATHLPPEPEQAARRKALAEAADHAAAAFDEVLRERQGWASVAPDASAFAALVDVAEAVDKEVRALAGRRDELRLEIAELEGMLRQDGADGAGATVALLKEQLAVAAARVADLELEVEALGLLAERLDRQGGRNRESELRPLLERLEPLLTSIFPGARLRLEGPLLATHLERQGLREDVTRLSDGTREQVAVLVRLAYAHLMADRGMALPLVLDDALVFSDDDRLAAMFGLLNEAARRHQVLVLSCHERAIDGLARAGGANRLSLTPWNEAQPTASPLDDHPRRRLGGA